MVNQVEAKARPIYNGCKKVNLIKAPTKFTRKASTKLDEGVSSMKIIINSIKQLSRKTRRLNFKAHGSRSKETEAQISRQPKFLQTFLAYEVLSAQ